MLDLSVQTNLYEIKDKEGDILHIKTPSQRFFNQLIGIQNASADIQVNTIYNVFRDILNLNIEGKEYSQDYVEQFDISIVVMVIKDYTEFLGEELKKL